MKSNMTSNLNNKVKKDFLSYANAVIKSRAISSVEDNLKPVHRRVLYSMATNKLWSNKKHVKSARVVGDILGNLHPHGDSSVYDALVRLAQPWKMRYPLIDIQGNMGNILGDDAAAMRYTECKLSKFGDLMLEELNSGAVKFKANYDDTNKEPIFLSSVFPNILANGNSGIAVGLGASLVPHNLGDSIDAILALIQNKNITTEGLLKIIQGPDFPTGGTIMNAEKLKEIYDTGKGTIILRSNYRVENIGKDRQQIVITEVPYLVSVRSGVIEPLKKLVVEEEFDLIDDIQDETNMNGVNLKIILKKGANVYRVLEELWSKTRLQVTQRVDNTVIIDGNPRTLNLIQMIKYYLSMRHQAIIDYSSQEYQKIQEKIIILKGLLTALDKIDEVIQFIKNSNSKNDARIQLIDFLKISEVQANAILDMRLSRLSKLEKIEIETELQQLDKRAKELVILINSPTEREKEIIKQLHALRRSTDKRKTKLMYSMGMSDEDLVVEQLNLLIFKDFSTYLTKSPVENLRIGKRGVALNSKTMSISTQILSNGKLSVFTDDGVVYHRNVLTIGLEQLEPFGFDGTPLAAADLSTVEKESYIIFVSSEGVVKKTRTTEYENTRNGTKTIKIRDKDKLIAAGIAKNSDFIYILGESGKIHKLPVSEITETGRMTIGAKGIGEKALSATFAAADDVIFTINKDGQGKITNGEDFNSTAKGGAGQVVADDTVGIANAAKGHVFVFAGNKNNFVDTTKFIIKGKTAVGAKTVDGAVKEVV